MELTGVKQDERRQSVREYYGKELKSSADLKTNACCPAEAMPTHLRPLVRNIHEEVSAKFYGCGSPIPPLLKGARVLDLGCGSGRDSYLISQLVGEDGEVVGVDMTEEQLACARAHEDWHREKFGYTQSNVTFLHGLIEDLRALGLEDDSFDVVVSNCVINLSADKEKVFSEVFRVLKPGGELYFSDVFTTRRVPEALRRDDVLVGECLGGALYVEDFRRMLARVGCHDHRVVSSAPIVLEEPALARKAGMIPFCSLTVRAFKGAYEDRCEDFGQVAYYEGTIDEFPHAFVLDDHHEFKTGQPVLVCGNTAQMLSESRFAPHFRIVGDRSVHYGLFDCGPTGGPAQVTISPLTSAPGGCC
ncbi:MAG: methyltransferase domain-containing protein [Pseudomonadota bacterium]